MKLLKTLRTLKFEIKKNIYIYNMILKDLIT